MTAATDETSLTGLLSNAVAAARRLAGSEAELAAAELALARRRAAQGLALAIGALILGLAAVALGLAALVLVWAVIGSSLASRGQRAPRRRPGLGPAG